MASRVVIAVGGGRWAVGGREVGEVERGCCCMGC